MGKFVELMDLNKAALQQKVYYCHGGYDNDEHVKCIQIDAPISKTNGETTGFETLLYCAAEAENTRAAVILLEAGADVDAGSWGYSDRHEGHESDPRSRHPLEAAALVNHRAMVKLLLEHGAERECGPNEPGVLGEPDECDRRDTCIFTPVSDRMDFEHYKLMRSAGFTAHCVCQTHQPETSNKDVAELEDVIEYLYEHTPSKDIKRFRRIRIQIYAFEDGIEMCEAKHRTPTH
jgi:hypothetical protein